MNKATLQVYLREANFRELFITEMGWNNYGGQAALPPIAVEDTEYQFTTIAERNGFLRHRFVVISTPNCVVLPTTISLSMCFATPSIICGWLPCDR